MSDLKLYDLPPSPNNMKIRIALNYKGLPFERFAVDPADQERRQIRELSGQPLTPVLVHGDRVICDSAAILRYLDTNFRDTPPLLFPDRPTALAADKLEKWARGPLTEPTGMVFAQAFSEAPDLEACRRASELMNTVTADIEERLADSEWLVGGRMSFVDVTAAPYVAYAMLPEEAAQHPIVRFFYDNLHLGEGRQRTREWCSRVMTYDR